MKYWCPFQIFGVYHHLVGAAAATRRLAQDVRASKRTQGALLLLRQSGVRPRGRGAVQPARATGERGRRARPTPRGGGVRCELNRSSVTRDFVARRRSGFSNSCSDAELKKWFSKKRNRLSKLPFKIAFQTCVPLHRGQRATRAVRSQARRHDGVSTPTRVAQTSRGEEVIVAFESHG